MLLHQERPPAPQLAKACERELERLLGHYDKGNYDLDKLMPAIHLAIQHARRLDTDGTALWPQAAGTRVYRLVMKLMGL